ncbi:antiviral helicase [Hymenopellis radicata]|nr:antiviral helicase [Hymenopellis radicata]
MVDLFSFLDDNPTADDAMQVGEVASSVNTSTKRKGSHELTDADGGKLPSLKRLRLSDSSRQTPLRPITLDDFETEAKRDVAAIAGLQGNEETGVRLELKHHQGSPPSCCSPGHNYEPISEHVPPAKPAREYAFELDPFQKVSVSVIQRNESVLVSAHTSAGKTVVAEYAIAQCLERKQRVIYTSPIKALSNQKYRDMVALFGDVGLMTGDVTINSSATCLVMTTEILRSMLYRGSEIIREVAWVIFDEIHYMRDKERGVVWEETIILLPHTVRYVFLSATIPNAMQFAEWICQIHDQPCHVVYTDYRPTPLQHYLFPSHAEGIYLVVNEKGEFKDENFTKAMGQLQARAEDPADSHSGKGRKGNSRKGGEKKEAPSDILRLVKRIVSGNNHPVIVFSFSKRDCDGHALAMAKSELNSEEEQSQVSHICSSALAVLPSEDSEFPHISQLIPLLRRGVGIHHSGLLPILKELVEILFQEGLIKVLFATETFSIGLNMPAKTVVFTGSRKFDGREQRTLSSGEYIQMSGRAGRRGLDDRGIVVLMCDEKLDPIVAKNMINGQPDRLDSAYHLGYNMTLNLMRIEGISAEYILERSFFQFQSRASIPQLETDLKAHQQLQNTFAIDNEVLVAEYYNVRQQLDRLANDMTAVITHPAYCLPFMKPGRLIHIKFRDLDFGWGILINYQKRKTSNKHDVATLPPNEQYVLDVLLNCAPGSAAPAKKTDVCPTPGGVMPCPSNVSGIPLVLPVLLSTVQGISHLSAYLPKDLRPDGTRRAVWNAILEIKRRFPDGISLLDPVENMGIKDDKFVEITQKIEVLESKLFANPLHADPRLPELYTLYSKKLECQERIRTLEQQINTIHNTVMFDELKSRKRVLRRLDFIKSDILELKGRVACEISTGDELLLTNLLFDGVFNTLGPEQCAALLSCFVLDEKSENPTKITSELAAPLRILQEQARRIAKVSNESKLDLDENAYVSSFRVELMEAVMCWCGGGSFTDTFKLTDMFEGSLIRVFRRLAELLRQMISASQVIGNSELQKIFEKALELLERPNTVIFCSSLYL